MRQKMIPPTPTALTMPASKAKIGFSIDSIVGDDVIRSPKDIKSDVKYGNDYQSEIARALRISDSLINRSDRMTKDSQGSITSLFEYPPNSNNHRESSISPSSYGPPSNLPSDDVQHLRGGKSPQRSPSPHRTISDDNQPFQNQHTGGPIRPMPMVPQNLIESKNIPPYLNLGGLTQAHNPHVLQAQFQMAAALAQRHAEHGFPPANKFVHHPPHLMNSSIARESYPLYPWLLSRHGRIFPHGFPGNFLLHPFRKPKRVRTAFSPSQLLKLEHAFESNQYVVGAERKALAQALNLSETQVKVWFQNRRTKHKRMQQEEDSKGGNNNGNSSSNNDSSQQNYNDDELIDMDDCYSDDECESPH